MYELLEKAAAPSVQSPVVEASESLGNRSNFVEPHIFIENSKSKYLVDDDAYIDPSMRVAPGSDVRTRFKNELQKLPFQIRLNLYHLAPLESLVLVADGKPIQSK